ncbi:MAG: AMP-binding protein, partial [Anaerolineaceae bacterium]|nr:AMP-binding protein [Anaerolineaceae bacterium]
MTTFSHNLLDKLARVPEQVSIYLQHTGQPDVPVTYRELLAGSAAYAHMLDVNGIELGEVVILILRHGIDLVNAFFGAVLHGSIPSIMPFLTEKLLPERYRSSLASLVAITKPVAIITYPEFEDEVRAALKPGDSVRAVIISDQVKPVSSPDYPDMAGLKRSPDDIVLLQHSSGTTGLQKGVALSHRAVFNQIESYSRAIRITPDDVIVSWLPLYHDMGLLAGFLIPVLAGIPLVLMSPFDWVRAPYRLMQAVSRYHGTLSWLPNFAYNFCAQKIRDRHMEGVDLSSWRAVINCSEPMRWDSHRIFLERFELFGFSENALATCYAMAENVFAVTQGGIASPVTLDIVDREALQNDLIAKPVVSGRPEVKMLSAGLPIDSTKVRVLSEDGADVPERSIGEIALYSNCMLTEYYNRPGETKKAFIDGWYLTGDYGYMANGEVYVSGRKKDLIIVGGKNVYPQDVERLVMDTPGVHPGRLAVFGIFNEKLGTEDVVVVAEVRTDD